MRGANVDVSPPLSRRRSVMSPLTTMALAYCCLIVMALASASASASPSTSTSTSTLERFRERLAASRDKVHDNANEYVPVDPEVALRCYDHTLQDESMVEAHRLRDSALVEQNVYAFRFPVSHLEWLQVVSIDVASVRWEGETDFCNTTLIGNSADSVRMAWATMEWSSTTTTTSGEQMQWPGSMPDTAAYFADLPTKCDADTERDQHYGVSISAGQHEWGSRTRVEHDGRLFRPRGGRRAMDAVVLQLNELRDRMQEHETVGEVIDSDWSIYGPLLAFELLVYYRSHSPVRMRALTVRKCLMERPQPQALGVMSLTSSAASPSTSNAERAALIDQLQAMPVALSGAIDSWPSLVPLRSCVWEEYASGTCFVDLGWLNVGSQTIEAKDCASGNCLHPKRVRDYTVMPTLFEPGWHRNHTRVAWLCRGIVPGEWVSLRWELGPQQAVHIDHTTPYCRNMASLQYGGDAEHEIIPFEHYRFDETGLRYWDAKHLAKMHSWTPEDETWLGETGNHLRPVDMNGQESVFLHVATNAECALHSEACSDDDDSGLLTQAAGVIILVDLIILGIAIYAGVSDPQALWYIVLTVDLTIAGFVIWNFMFAPSLNRSNGVTAPEPLVGAQPNIPNIVN